MAAGGFVKDTNQYWLWQAQNAYVWSLKHPEQRWEQLMYWYLFKWCGYEQ
jgi:hypothetical protein